jgi:hypothetical protein
MQYRLQLSVLALTLPVAVLADATFDPATRLLTVPVITVSDKAYRDVVLRLDEDGQWNISSGPTEWSGEVGTASISDECGQEHITKERFAAAEFGMSYDDAIAAVGCRGELVAEGLDDGAHIKAYHFEYGDSNFDLTFKDGELAGKRQTIYEDQ